MQLSCRVDGRGFVLNDDHARVRGGLYHRHPWFNSDAHDPVPLDYSRRDRAILRLGTHPDRIWHLGAASPRSAILPGHLEGCTVEVRARISPGALLQVGMDYRRNPDIGYGSGGNNHEAGASDWYFPSDRWQEAILTDVQR